MPPPPHLFASRGPPPPPASPPATAAWACPAPGWGSAAQGVCSRCLQSGAGRQQAHKYVSKISVGFPPPLAANGHLRQPFCLQWGPGRGVCVCIHSRIWTECPELSKVLLERINQREKPACIIFVPCLWHVQSSGSKVSNGDARGEHGGGGGDRGVNRPGLGAGHCCRVNPGAP